MQARSLEEKFKLVLSTIKAYPAQLEQAWDEVSKIDFPPDYKEVENIVFCGMGGSALGARMVDSFTSENRLRVPFEIFTEYHLPDYADDKSLVILSSYSGSTEETINAAQMAVAKRAKIFGITTGGKLAEILKKESIPTYIFDPKNNPSGQPRMSLGYASGAILAIISKLGLAHIAEADIGEAIETMESAIAELDEKVPEGRNEAIAFVKKIKRKAPVLVASEHLIGVTHAIKNQFNESAKTFATLFDLPEVNHHLIEGLSRPLALKKLLHFVFFTSDLYPKRVQRRYPLTADVVRQNGIDYDIYHVSSKTKLAQIYEVLVFGSFVVYYLTRDLGIDPMKIPWVDYFKEKLSP
ncbi:hypothetical protein HYT59_01855 [Candidatus Woesebacteria bacterium]|nr:hypothetical protein [Candidatus Woesebacteria bacterium]